MMSSEDIRQMSSFEVKTAKISSTNLLETVHDPKSGPMGSAPWKHVIKTNGLSWTFWTY